jgi:hypothetical protein
VPFDGIICIMYRTFFLLIILGLFGATPIFAQSGDISPASDITISMTPSNPDPGERIVLEIKSYGVNLNQANIVWRYNGKIVSSGIGRTSINTVAPNANSTGLITATVSGAGFETISTALDIRTAKVDLLWEAADSYTPPFYKGKALLSTNGLIRVTAIPARSAPKNISYEWSRNDAVVQSASGYNKNSFTFRNETLKRQERISVTSESGLYGGTSSITLVPTLPQLVLYKKEEGFIDYNKGYTSTMTTTDPGITLRFEPYFFSSQRNSLSTDLVFEIKNNDNIIYGNQKPNEISLSRPDNGGLVNIGVSVNTSVYSLQNVLKQFSIIFN